MSHISNQSAGTLGGAFLAFVGVLDFGDMLKTAILAAVGAIVSFTVSSIMKYLFSDPSEKDDASV